MVCLVMSSLSQIVFEFSIQSLTHFIDSSLYLFICCCKKYSKFKLDWMSAIIKAAVKNKYRSNWLHFCFNNGAPVKTGEFEVNFED